MNRRSIKNRFLTALIISAMAPVLLQPAAFAARTLMGDLNGDGWVDFDDLSIFSKAYGASPGLSGWNAGCDLNGDGKVDVKDLDLLKSNYNLNMAPELLNGLSFSDPAGAANNGKTRITLGSPSASGNTFRYFISPGSGEVLAPVAGYDAGGWTAAASGDLISVSDGRHIGVAEVDSGGRVVRFSDAAAVVVNESGGGGNTGGGSSGGNTPPKSGEEDVKIIVNGEEKTAAKASTETIDGKKVTTVVLDDTKVEEMLNSGSGSTVVTIPVNNNSDVVVGSLNGQTVRNMEAKDAILEVKTGSVTFTLPAAQINIGSVSESLGSQADLKDISVNVRIAEPPADTARIIEDTAGSNSYQVVVRPVEFEITCTSGDKTVEVSRFSAYVERTVAIPDGIDPARVTTGIVLNSDGTFSHVPTSIVQIGGRYYARINSLTNSVYSVIWNPKTFKDAEGHWAREAIEDMASRLVIAGTGEDRFEPDSRVTRGEFAAIVVRALGLMRTGTGKDVFKDVSMEDPNYDAVSIAYEYGIVSGSGAGSFGPSEEITREQAMAVIARAMGIAGLENGCGENETETLLSAYGDAGEISGWARSSAAVCIRSEIISGSGGQIAAKRNITRAEAAVIVRKLLQRSGLI